MRYLMGSRYFFEGLPEFNPHDTDTIELVKPNSEFKTMRVIRGQGKDMYFFVKKPKEEMIQDALNSQLAMVVGKFLIPEFNKEIGFTVEDLLKIKPLMDRIDEKHLYEKMILEYYLENGKFELTEEQRLAVYKEYKRLRS